MIAAPLIARLLLANALKVSCVPPEVAVTWPASGTGAPPGTPGPAAWPAGSGTVSGAAIADPRVQDAVGHVGGQVPDHGGHPDDQRPAENHRVVVGARGLPEQKAHPGEVEHRLRDHRSGHDVG